MTATTTLEPAHVAMPELDAGALARLGAALASERAALGDVVAERAATVAELTGQGDVDSLLEREVADASAARALDAIEDIDAALARIDAGTYGLCEACRRPIPVERLEVIPHARLCVPCSARPESR
jgi:RNA polymerase-binding transcription factor DksA